jgi:hypothetical protein
LFRFIFYWFTFKTVLISPRDGMPISQSQIAVLMSKRAGEVQDSDDNSWICPVCCIILQGLRAYRAHIGRFKAISEQDLGVSTTHYKTPSGRDPKCCISAKNPRHMQLLSRCKPGGTVKESAVEFATMLYQHSLTISSSDDKFSLQRFMQTCPVQIALRGDGSNSPGAALAPGFE